MSNHPNAPSPFAPPSGAAGAPPAASATDAAWAAPSAPAGPPPAPAGPPPYLAGPAGFGPPPYPSPSLGGTDPAAPLGPPTVPPSGGPPVAPIGGSFAPGPVRSAPPAGEPRRVRPWISGLAVGAVIGAVVASLVAGGIYVASVKTGGTVDVVDQPVSRTPVTIKGEVLDIGALLDKVRPSVVSIQIDGGMSGEAAGSGIVIDDQGTVLTNAHVVAGAAGSSTAIHIAFSDGEVVPATLVGSFPDQDVALVKTTTAKKTSPAELGSSDALQVGDDVVAIGNALNLGAQPSVTKGIVSALNRELSAEGEELENLIQTDAAINPGNSGGPLVNSYGQVVGINTAIIQNSQSVGFALSIDSVKPLIKDIEDGKGTIDGDSPFLGVETMKVADQSEEILQRFQISVDDGAFVSDVQPGSAADKAGLQPGDVVVSIDGAGVASPSDVGAAIQGKAPGDTISIEIQRQGEAKTLSAALGRRGG